ncbi:MAG: carboxymuconolactone decarboxylase family protein [Parvularculaceae bacterium]|nr:carboxymuconolactone decarboxylase family protein [Parvularculaceae bacterium]
MTGRRINFPEPENMSAKQRAVYDEILTGPRRQIVGPLRAWLISPELARRNSAVGEHLRFGDFMPERLKELAILITGRRYSSEVEWWVHAREAEAAGVDKAVIKAINTAAPIELSGDDWTVYEFTRELHETGNVSQHVYEEIKQSFGENGVVELTALVGYYTMVSMTLNAHQIPLPEGQKSGLAPLNQGGLVTLKPATKKKGP